MASRRELDRLEDENRTLCQRLSDVEVELKRKDDTLKAVNLRKIELLNDLREYQHKLKDLKVQLERAQEGELEAKGAAHDIRQELEHAETQLRDQAASSKSAIANLQLEIKSLKSKLAQSEEKCSSISEQLHFKDNALHSLKNEATKRDSQDSSRVANLNQALMQAKQVCAQLTEDNDLLKNHEQELLQKLESVEKELSQKKEMMVCKQCEERESCSQTFPKTPVRQGSYRVPGTPVKPVPEETQLDFLQAENTKLKMELQCLQTNFQLVSQKSIQLKKDKKEIELSLSELQILFDRTASQRDSLQSNLDEAKVALVNKLGSQIEEKERVQNMTAQVADLREELDKLQKQNLELQEKLQAELNRSLDQQDTVEKMDNQVKTLKEEKASMESQLEVVQAKLDCVQEEYSSLQASSQSASDFGTKVTELKQIYTRQIDSLKQEQHDTTQKLEAAVKSVDEAQEQIKSMAECKQSLEVKVSALEARNTALLRENKTLSSAPNELGELQLKYVELSELSDEKDSRIHKTEGRLQQLEAHIHDLEHTKSKLTREASRSWELANQLQKELEKQEMHAFELEGANKEETYKYAMFENKIQEMKVELATAHSQKSTSEEEVSKLLQRLEELEQCNFELTSKLSGIESETESAKLTSSEAHKKMAELEEKLNSAKDALLEKEAQVTSLNFGNEVMEAENSTLLAQVTSLSEMVASRNAKIDALQAQLSKYDLEMSEIAESIAELEVVHGSCAQTKQALEDKIDTLKSSLQEASEYKKEAETVILSLRLDIKQFQECNNCLEAINADLQEKIQAQFTRIDELKDSQEMSEKCIQQLQQEVEIKSDSLREAHEKIDGLKKKASTLSSDENAIIPKGKLKGILKSSSGGALRPVENLVD